MRDTFRVMDKDGDGFITAAAMKLLVTKLGKSILKVKDRDIRYRTAKNISVTVYYQIKTIFYSGEKITDEEVYEIIREVDTDGDGQISFEEFTNAMSSKL